MLDLTFAGALGGALTAAFGVSLAVLHARQRRREARLRAAQDALRVSEERLRLALEATSEIVWDWDLATDAIYHPRWASAYGYPEEVTPRTGAALIPFVHPDDLADFGAQVEGVKHGTRDGIEVEHRMRNYAGEWRWMLGKARVVSRGPGGEALRLVGTCVDVTERRRMIERLQLADRMVSVGTLAAGVAHEINNPLAFLSGNLAFSLEALDALAAGPEAQARTLEECRAALREASQGAERVQRIVGDLRVLSRSHEERRVPVDVARALETAVHLAGNDVRQRARFVTSLSAVSPVLGDESRLSQVFLNLLVNAAQAIPQGRPEENEIEVTLHQAGGRVVLAVRDTGCGIPPEHLRRIFDPFFTTKPVGVGTGLGLAISHGIITALGGEIDVASTPGRGSTFTVSLPVTAAEDVPRPGAAERVRPVRRGRILVVDDEPLFCASVQRILGRDHDVSVAGAAEEALRRIEGGERFDVILSDLIMPRVSGMELHDAVLRGDPELAGRMIFVTGGAFTPAAAEFVARMRDRVLDKPLAPEALRAAVAAVLEGRRPAA